MSEDIVDFKVRVQPETLNRFVALVERWECSPMAAMAKLVRGAEGKPWNGNSCSSFERLFMLTGGANGFARLRQVEPKLARALMDAYDIEL